MYPMLVEPNIKNVINSELRTCKQEKFYRNSNYLNIGGFLFIASLVSFTLWLKYQGQGKITSSPAPAKVDRAAQKAWLQPWVIAVCSGEMVPS